MANIDKRNYTYVLQKKNYDCGVAASAMLLVNAKYKNINYSKLGKHLSLTKNGVSYKKIASFFKNFSELKPRVKTRSSLEFLKKETRKGRIALVCYQTWGKPHEVRRLVCGHYGVVVKIYRNKVYLLDPSGYKNWGDGLGWRIMDIREFNKLWIDRERGRVVRKWMVSVKPLPRKKALKLAN